MAFQLTLSYYPWITQSISGSALATAIKGFAKLLEPELARKLGSAVELTVLPEMAIPDQIRDIKTPPASVNDAKIALMNPVGYALTHEAEAAVEAVAVVRRRIGTGPAGPSYKAQIYVNALTGITSLAELRKRSFAFGSPQSTSNFLVPAHMLWQSGLHPANGFARLEFAGGHDLAAIAVYEGRSDAGAGHDGVIVDLAEKPGFSNAAERLKRLEWSKDIPSDPIAVHARDVRVKAGIQVALLSLAKPNDAQSAGNQAIKRFWGTEEGLEAINPDGYRSLLPYLTDLSLRPDDLLRQW
jgi:ABC-type phosphate/phosphonate transport system substrate-binding protein